MSDHTLLVAALRDLYDDSQHMKTQAANAIESLQAECERLRAELAAEQAAYERGIRKAAAICYELGEKVMHPTQTITRRCEAAILAEIGEKP